jgi:hypothetical protein
LFHVLGGVLSIVHKKKPKRRTRAKAAFLKKITTVIDLANL